MALSVLFIAVTLISCGGGGGGGGGGVLPSTTPAGTFTKTVNHAGGATSYGNLFSTPTENRYMMLYLAQDVKGSGNIKSISFKNNSGTAAAVTCPNVTVKMGHTSVGTLSATYAANVEEGRGTFATALNNASVTIPAGAAGDYFTVNLGTQFNYNGADNLVVEVTRTAACTDMVAVGANVASPSYNGIVWAITSSTAVTGTAQPNVIDMRFAYAGGDDRVEYPVATGNAIPFWASASEQHAQMLHLASDLNGSGPITGIAMISSEAPTDAASYTVTVKLGHTSLAALTDTFANNFNVGSPVTVAAAATFTVPAGVPAGTPIWLPLSGTFKYNGTDNLIVDIEVTSADTITFWVYDGAIAGRRMYAAVGSATGTVDNGAYHTVFRFNGGPMVKLSAGTGINNAIFNGLDSTATLYSATDLGTAGKITSVSCRMKAASTAASYADFKVVMGHATGSTLSGTAATDFVSQKTVFSGTFAVPAGLLAGDWLDIPLSSSFAYDGKSNLIVWMGNGGTDPGTAVVNNCMGENNATRYPGGLGVATTGVGSASYIPLDWTTDIRMTVQK